MTLFGFGSQNKKRDLGSVLGDADEARDAEQWLQAAANYDTALSIDPDQPGIWVQFAHCVKEFGAFSEAIKAYRNAIKLRPDDAETHVHLAHLLKRTGSYAAAKLEFQNAVRLNPSDVESASELDMLEERATAEAVVSKPSGQSNEAAGLEMAASAKAGSEKTVLEDASEQEYAPQEFLFREFEVSASHFAQEGAIKALNSRLQSEVDLLREQNEGLQKELLKQAGGAKSTRGNVPRSVKSGGRSRANKASAG